VRGHVNQHQVVRLGMARNPVQPFLDVFRCGLVVRQHMHMVRRKTANRRIRQFRRERRCIGRGVVEFGNALIAEAPNTNH
jgi:hypothetical protein